MAPITGRNVTKSQGEYVPYFYSAGIIQKYLQPKRQLHTFAPTSKYDFSSDPAQTHPFSRTVDDVIERGYFAVPKSDPETALISDKKHTSWLGLDDIIGQIRNRHTIYERNIYEIEISKCAAINTIYKHEALRGPASSKQEYAVHKRLDNLYAQQREERVNHWRDISRVKLQLPETAQSYLVAYRKVSILRDDGGDGQ